jgi:hypothetical protein
VLVKHWLGHDSKGTPSPDLSPGIRRQLRLIGHIAFAISIVDARFARRDVQRVRGLRRTILLRLRRKEVGRSSLIISAISHQAEAPRRIRHVISRLSLSVGIRGLTNTSIGSELPQDGGRVELIRRPPVVILDLSSLWGCKSKITPRCRRGAAPHRAAAGDDLGLIVAIERYVQDHKATVRSSAA